MQKLSSYLFIVGIYSCFIIHSLIFNSLWYGFWRCLK